MRKKALETLGETQKWKADQGEEHVKQKKHRTSEVRPWLISDNKLKKI